ncbi:MAG: GNAT family N-acetyltransferase [Mycobacteriales bacterium]
MDTTTAVLSPDQRVDLLAPLGRLLKQFSPSVDAVSDDVLAQRLRDDRLVLVVAWRDDVLVAIATLALVPTASLGLVGHVDDVVVDESLRGGGIGRILMKAVHEEARRLGLRHLDLTSRPTREAANALYRSLGYECRVTNVYRLRL